MKPRKTSTVLDNKNRYALMKNLTQLYQTHGYAQISIPIYERNINASENASAKAFQFIDPLKGVLTLQNDPTTSIMKMIQSDGDLSPQKYCYYANTFGYKDNTLTEMSQVGLESYGDDTATSDAEMIVLALKSLKSLQNNVLVEASDIRFYRVLSNVLLNHYPDPDALEQLIYNKNATKIACMENLNPNVKDFILNFLSCTGYYDGVFESVSKIINSPLISKEEHLVLIDAKANLDFIYQYAKAYHLEGNLIFDLTSKPDFDYYNGLIFKGYLKNAPEAVCSGGRYDPLSLKFGQFIHACGFALKIDRILSSIETKKIYRGDALLIYEESISDQGIQIAEIYRSKGYLVDIRSNGSEKDAIDLAQSQAVENIILIDSKIVKVINLRRDDVKKYPLDQFISSGNLSIDSESIH